MPIAEAAKEWSVPPWELEEEAPALWMERWRVMREETAAATKPKRKPKG